MLRPCHAPPVDQPPSRQRFQVINRKGRATPTAARPTSFARRLALLQIKIRSSSYAATSDQHGRSRGFAAGARIARKRGNRRCSIFDLVVRIWAEIMSTGAHAGIVAPLGRSTREKPVALPPRRERADVERHPVRRQRRFFDRIVGRRMDGTRVGLTTTLFQRSPIGRPVAARILNVLDGNRRPGQFLDRS
jgi:hypothetical protein